MDYCVIMQVFGGSDGKRYLTVTVSYSYFFYQNQISFLSRDFFVFLLAHIQKLLLHNLPEAPSLHHPCISSNIYSTFA